MGKTVEEGFRTFLGRLTPTGGESEAAKKHRISIEGSLKNNFGITQLFRTGSFGNGTSISGYSDVDYFAIIPTENLKENSNTTLRDVRDALNIRFPNTGVAVRTPAVLIPFGKIASERTEVVPSDFIKTDEGGYQIYDIPDGSGGWIKSSPNAHNAYVANIDKKLSNKVKPLVRFLKAWKYYRNVPISSFYLELRVAKYASEETSILYSIDIKKILKQLYDSQLAAIQDPMGVSGYIYPCVSDNQKSDALSKLKIALGRAEKAREAETSENLPLAFHWWNLLYAEQFPSHY